jgi:hypothetical protein
MSEEHKSSKPEDSSSSPSKIEETKKESSQNEISKSSFIFTQPIATCSDGDCGIHAILGGWDTQRSEIYCPSADKVRAEVAAAIKEAKPTSEFTKLILSGIRELVMSGIAVGPNFSLLKQRYDLFVDNQKSPSSTIWQTFEAVLEKYPGILGRINSLCELPSEISLTKRFHEAFNKDEDATLYIAIMALPDLYNAFQEYNSEIQKGFDWETELTWAVRKEYADFISQLRSWLLPSELGLIAHVFQRTVVFYTAPNAKPVIFNPDKDEPVVVEFVGNNHFRRRVDTEEHNRFLATIQAQKPLSNSKICLNNKERIEESLQIFARYLEIQKYINVYVDVTTDGTGHIQATLDHAIRLRGLGFRGAFNFILGRTKRPYKNSGAQCTVFGEAESCDESDLEEGSDDYQPWLEKLDELLGGRNGIGEHAKYAANERWPRANFGFTGAADDFNSNMALYLDVRFCIMWRPHLWKKAGCGIWLEDQPNVIKFPDDIEALPFCNIDKDSMQVSRETVYDAMENSVKQFFENILDGGNRRIVITYNIQAGGDSETIMLNIGYLVNAFIAKIKIVVLDFNSRDVSSAADVFSRSAFVNTIPVVSIDSDEAELTRAKEKPVFIAKCGYIRSEIFNYLIKDAILVVCEGQGLALKSMVLGTPLIHIPKIKECQIYDNVEHVFRLLFTPQECQKDRVSELTFDLKKYSEKFRNDSMIEKQDAELLNLLTKKSSLALYSKKLSEKFSLATDKFSVIIDFAVNEGVIKLENSMTEAYSRFGFMPTSSNSVTTQNIAPENSPVHLSAEEQIKDCGGLSPEHK